MASRRKAPGDPEVTELNFSLRKVLTNGYVWIGVVLSGLVGLATDFDKILEIYRKYTMPAAPSRVEISDLKVYPSVGIEGPPGSTDFLNNTVNFLVHINARNRPTPCDYKFAIDPVFVPTILGNPQPFEIPANVSSYEAQHVIMFQPPSPFKRYTFRVVCDGTASNAVTFDVVQRFDDIDYNSPMTKAGERRPDP